MVQDIIQYLSTHPGILAALLLFCFLALVGGWYVIHHHLKLILVTLLCAGGFASGVLVAYRGVKGDMRDLVAIGLFLIAIFPVIFTQALKTSKIAYGSSRPSPTDKGHARRAGV